MAGLFDGLEGFGFEDVNVDLAFKTEEAATQAVKKKEQDPSDFIFDRKFTCPVCGKDFSNWSLRASKIRLERSDLDLRAYYTPYDPLYYDAIICTHCGYSAMLGNFNKISDTQSDKILEQIKPKYKSKIYEQIYTIDDAIERYKFALYNTVVKGGKTSEKAYCCLKLAWLCRDKEDKDGEMLYLKNAYEGLLVAFEKEALPIYGMDEDTLSYLLAELARRLGDYETSLRFLGRVLTSKTAKARIKDKCFDVKQLVFQSRAEKGIKD